MRFWEALARLGSRHLIVGEIASVILLAKSCAHAPPPPCDGCAGGAGGDGGSTETAGGGAGGSGGETSSGGTTGGTGGAGGSVMTGGTGGCAPAADPCGDAVCGAVDDGCGTPVECGSCNAGQPCVDGQCCAPKTCDDYPGACEGSAHDNGCGGTIFCGDAVCGDGQWMTCAAGSCACQKATLFANAQQSQAVCDQQAPGKKAYYCGAIGSEVPADCVWTAAANGAVAGNPGVWCCP